MDAEHVPAIIPAIGNQESGDIEDIYWRYRGRKVMRSHGKWRYRGYILEI